MLKRHVSAILLAAGQAKRMGRPKLLLPFGDSTILEKSLDNLLKSGVTEVIVVVGNQAEKTIEKIGKRPVKTVLNPNYAMGMSTSIIKGLNAVSEKTEAIMLVLADQPLIESNILIKLLEAFFSHDRGIIVPVYQGRRGHPVIFDMKSKNELMGLKGDVGAREVVNRHPGDVLEVPVDAPGIHADIDTEADYRAYSG